MGGPSAHGQRNKAHKAGRHASKGARARHRDQKAAVGKGGHAGAKRAQQSKEQRVQASKAARDAKRRQLVEQRRHAGAPRLLGVMCLHCSVDTHAAWQQLYAACWAGVDVPSQGVPMTPLSLGRSHKTTVALLPPLTSRDDPLAVVDMARAADMLVLVIPETTSTSPDDLVDQHGAMMLTILRSLGMPSCMAAVHTPMDASPPKNNVEALKQRAAVKKHASAMLNTQGLSGCGVFWLSGDVDQGKLLRYIATHPLSLPAWRGCRPSVVVEGVDVSADGLVGIRGYTRGPVGLSANQLIHVPGAGDYQIHSILAAQPPAPINTSTHPTRPSAGAGGGGNGVESMEGMEVSAPATPQHTLNTPEQAVVLALPDVDVQDTAQREHEPDTLAGEQTWPTEEELHEAQQQQHQKQRVPRGTSAYQAAWLLDGEDYGTDLESQEEEEEEKGNEEGGYGGYGGGNGGGGLSGRKNMGSGVPQGVPLVEEESMWEPMDDGGTDVMQGDLGSDDDDDNDQQTHPGAWAAAKKARRAAEAEEEAFPDEIDTPVDTPARTRFARYRGLKSWRSSAWDPKESLPQEYSRVFAFEQFTRAHKRARAAQQAAGTLTDIHGVAPGACCVVVLKGVPIEVATHLQQRVAAATHSNGGGGVSGGVSGCQPPVVVGLMQHEAKLSVVHWGVNKAPGYDAPLANKEELLFVTGTRTFHARPIFSTDDISSDKHKMERYLHAGRPAIASVYAPICFPPMPLLAFKVTPGQPPELAMTGSLRSCNPDRIILKKIILSGYPVKVHKHKAVVKYMFFNPDDVRWFRSLELWTKYGRRGRIREPVGTHGLMKCIFDGPIRQQDGVCLSLYKRVYPKWPTDMTFG